MIYLFRKNNKRITVTAAHAAWEMYSSNGDWKYRPIYLGAVENHEYRALKEKVQNEFPISDELIEAVNSGERTRDREMRRLHNQQADREAELLEEAAQRLGVKRQNVPTMTNAIFRHMVATGRIDIRKELKHY